MKKKIISILACAAMAISLVPQAMAATETTLYVAPNGSDSAAGTVDAPLATMNGARLKVRALKAEGVNVREVIFQEGEYFQTAVKFTAEDSGTDGVITYKAADGAKVKFKGSRALDYSIARKVTATEDAEIWDRLYDSVKGKLYVYDLTKAYGISQANICDPVNIDTLYALTSWGEYNPLIVNGREAMIAQWPNAGQYTSFVEGLEVKEEGYENGKKYLVKAIRYAEETPDRWVNAKNWWVSAFPTYNYTLHRSSVVSIDPENNIIKFPASTSQEYTGQGAKRWKAFNLIEEIDLPGEYYIDRDNMKLYYYPDCDLSTAKVELAVENVNLVNVSNASDITFEGLTFANSCGNGVATAKVNNVDFINCSFQDIAGKGLIIGGGDNEVTGADYWQQAFVTNNASYNVNIKGCNFERIGGEALVLRGGNIDTLTDSGNIAEDNHITLANQRFLSNGSAIMVSGCGNIFRNNNIHRLDYQAIMIAGNNHLIEGNEIYDVMRTTGDGGAIYQGRNQLYRGSEITKNYIHDVKPMAGITTGTCGIYMDDGQQGNKITQNIIADVGTGYNSHYASAMKVQNNVFINCMKPWAFHEGPTSYGTETMNLSSMTSDTTGKLWTVDELMNQIADKDLYLKEYDDLKTWYETKANPRTLTVVSGNLVIGSRFGQVDASDEKYTKWSATEGVENDNRMYTATSEFVDQKNHDYRLKSGFYLAKSMPGLLNNSNFEMTSIGLLTKRMLNIENSPYRIIYPADGETFNVASEELFWQEAMGANEYLLEISTDSKFNIVVYQKTVNQNITKISDGNFTDGKTYYWRVTATNVSKDLGATWLDENAKGTFVAEVN